jgi:hypothetical protein
MGQERDIEVDKSAPGASILLGVAAVLIALVSAFAVVAAIADSPSGPTSYELSIGFGGLIMACLIAGMVPIINRLNAISLYLREQTRRDTAGK